MSDSTRTLADLINSGYVSPTAKDVLAGIVRKKILAGEELFSDIFGIEMEKRRFVEVLIAGKGVLLTGAYGVAKTDLANHVLGLMNEYYEQEQVYFVERCPVQEEPEILLNYMKRGEKAGPHPHLDPCPICKKLIRDAEGDPSRIAVGKLDRLVEGPGFSRVQGGGDVLPEEIIGTYNLLKLSQIGDPFDPRVFEPGKIGQSSRGLLFVDEIGKLPETAQHALIQASQESIVTPSKSRETFPVDFVLVATTNPVDEEYICGAVRDRLVSIKIPMAGLEDEIRIVKKEIERMKPSVYVPKIFLKLAVEIIRAIRGDERLEMGPRTSINAGLIGRSSALLEGGTVVSFCNIKEGIHTAILGKALFEDKEDIEKKIEDISPEIASYIDRNLDGIQLDEIVTSYHDTWGDDAEWSPSNIKKLITAENHIKELEQFSQWIYANETMHKFRIYDVMTEYLKAYERGCDATG
jgi:Mg-chelatase subunit ChlI